MCDTLEFASGNDWRVFQNRGGRALQRFGRVTVGVAARVRAGVDEVYDWEAHQRSK
jgi:hypothetical protein